MKNKFKNKQKGFTLVETLVTMFILMIILVGSLGIYTYSIKAQRRTVDITLVSQDIQFLMTTLSRNIRASDIDYKYYEDARIVLADSDGPKILDKLVIYNPIEDKGWVYKQLGDQAVVCFCDGRCDADEECTVDGDFEGITTHKLKITNTASLVIGGSGLKFLIVPSELPFGAVNPIQPRVTISLNANGAGENLTVQQTIPQRFFERR